MLADKLSTKDELDEKDLLQQMRSGDYSAFTKLYKKYVTQLTNYAFKFTYDTALIEDVLHDIFVWLWNNRLQLEVKYSAKAYLLKCVRTALIKKIYQSKKITAFDNSAQHSSSNCISSAEEMYINSEDYFLLRGKITHLISSLTARQKEIIYLRFYEELSFEEIAANMNLSIKACYKLMGRAMAELRKTGSPSFQYL